MGDYGLFDDVNENEAKLTRQASAETDKVNEAVFEAKRRYASFVANSKDEAEFRTRLAYLGNDVHTLVANYTTPTPAVMRKVRAALKPMFAAKAWSAEYDTLNDGANAASDKAWNLHEDKQVDAPKWHQIAIDRHSKARGAAPNDVRADYHNNQMNKHIDAKERFLKDYPNSKTASVKTAWNYDPKAKTYTATGLDSIAFSCPNCSSVHDELGFNRCKCGKVWNSYAIKSGDKTANGTTLICREVAERPTVLASVEDDVKIAEASVPKESAYELLATLAEKATGMANKTNTEAYHRAAATEHGKAAKSAPTDGLRELHEAAAKVHREQADMRKKELKTTTAAADCPVCGGSGRLKGAYCKECNGSGESNDEEMGESYDPKPLTDEQQKKMKRQMAPWSSFKSAASSDADFELGWNTAKAGIDLPAKEASLSRDWYEGYIAALKVVADPTSDPDGFIIPGEDDAPAQDLDEWKQEQEDYARVEDMNNDKPRDDEPFEPVPFKNSKVASEGGRALADKYGNGGKENFSDVSNDALAAARIAHSTKGDSMDHYWAGTLHDRAANLAPTAQKAKDYHTLADYHFKQWKNNESGPRKD